MAGAGAVGRVPESPDSPVSQGTAPIASVSSLAWREENAESPWEKTSGSGRSLVMPVDSEVDRPATYYERSAFQKEGFLWA